MKLKGPSPLSSLSSVGETKAFYIAKSQVSSEAKSFYNAKSPAAGEGTTLSSARPSGKVNALSGTKFTAFKAKLASCESISIKAEASRAQAADEISAICDTEKASGKASARSGTKSNTFYKAKGTSGNVKPISCEVKANANGEASPILSKIKAPASDEASLALSRAKAPVSGEASLAFGAKIPALFKAKRQKFAKWVNRKRTPKSL